MTASIRFDQVGIPASTGTGARTDGLANGARVTARNESGAPCRMALTWIPPDDTTVVASLGQDAPDEWHFDPMAARYGSYLLRCIEAEGTADETVDEKVFGIRLPSTQLLIPALNERGDPLVTLADSVARKAAAAALSHNNEPNPEGFRWFAWWQAIRALFLVVESVGSGGLSAIATNRTLANVSGVSAVPTATDPQALVFRSAALASNGLELQVAPQEPPLTFTGLATAGSVNLDTTTLAAAGDGIYDILVTCTMETNVANDIRSRARKVKATLVGATLTLGVATGVDVVSGGNETGLALSLSAASGQLRTQVSNTTGATCAGRVHVGWTKEALVS